MYQVNNFCKQDKIEGSYKNKLISADKAAQLVKSGDKIHIGQFAGICKDIEAAIARRVDELTDVVVCDTLWSYPDAYEMFKVDPNGEHFRIHSTHFSKSDRVVNKMGNAWFIPIIFREGNKNWCENSGGLNVVYLPVTPMDKHGNFSLGPTVGETRGVLQAAEIIVLEVNENIPRANGVDNLINLSQADYIVESSNYPMPTLPPRDADGTDQKIAQHVMPLIESGSCIQLGIGAMPNHLGKLIAASDLNDLSVHTEMFVDAYVDMYNTGKITGNKSRDKGKMVYTFALGSQDMWDFLNDNPIACCAPVDYVNDISVIASIDKMISINSCLQVDIFGQVNSESIGFQHISGTGGAMDFAQGAFMSKGGKSFVCTASTKKKKDGTLEPLVLPYLPPGAIVTIPRSMVQYLVTEYGCVLLKGKSTWERAEAIISISHPDFREDLIKAAEIQGIWSKTSKLPGGY